MVVRIVNFIFGDFQNIILLQSGKPISISFLSDDDLLQFARAVNVLCNDLNIAIVERLNSLKNVEK